MKTYVIPKSIYDSAAVQSGITAALIGLSVLLPVLFHAFLPGGGVKSGSSLLPMFYAPVLGFFLLKKKYIFVIGMAAPLANYFLTGNPAGGMLLLLTSELIVFTFFLIVFGSNKKILPVAAPLALIAAKAALYLLMIAGIPLHSYASAAGYLTRTFTVAYPGLVILLFLSLASGLFERKNG